jgi:hypothetical protein
VKDSQAIDLAAAGPPLKMLSRPSASSSSAAAFVCALALFQSLSVHASNASSPLSTSSPPPFNPFGAVSLSYYYPRFWPQGSVASVTIVGSGFTALPPQSLGVTVGDTACAAISVRSDSEFVCTTSQTYGTGLGVGYINLIGTHANTNVTYIPPRAVVDLARQLGIQTPPFGDAWKHSFLPSSSDVVFNLNCRLKDGKVIINELSGNAECSSIDVNDWERSSLAHKFLYSSLPKFLSLGDSEHVLRVSSDSATAKLTVRFLGSQSSSGGDFAAQKLQQMFANGQFHLSFGRIITSMCTPSLHLRLLPSCTFFTRFIRVYLDKKTALKLSGLDETLPGTHIFLIYLGCLAAVFLLRQFFTFYQLRAKDPQRKLLKQNKKAELAKKNEADKSFTSPAAKSQ